MKFILIKYILIIFIFPPIIACTKNSMIKEKIVPEKTKLNERLVKMFSKTKLLCFGRYALKVPVESKLIIGSNTIDVEKNNNE